MAEMVEEKIKKSDYVLMWLGFSQGLVFGLLIYHFLVLSKWKYPTPNYYYSYYLLLGVCKMMDTHSNY